MMKHDVRHAQPEQDRDDRADLQCPQAMRSEFPGHQSGHPQTENRPDHLVLWQVALDEEPGMQGEHDFKQCHPEVHGRLADDPHVDQYTR